MIPDTFLHFAHKGSELLAPENTLAAFELAATYRPDAIELDIQMTRDGHIVVIHDPTVDRTTDGHGPVADFTLAELQRLDAGYRFTPDGGKTYPFRGKGVTVPTLLEVFGRFPNLLINIDLKEPAPGKEERVWRTVQEADAARNAIVGSFFCASLRRFRLLSGGTVATSACPREVTAFVFGCRGPTIRFLRPVYQALQVPEVHRGIRIVSPTSIRAAHRLGLKVHVWTVNESTDMERLLDWGVDGIVTDRPDLLAAILGRRQQDTSQAALPPNAR